MDMRQSYQYQHKAMKLKLNPLLYSIQVEFEHYHCVMSLTMKKLEMVCTIQNTLHVHTFCQKLVSNYPLALLQTRFSYKVNGVLLSPPRLTDVTHILHMVNKP